MDTSDPAVDRLGEKQRDYLLLTLYTGLREGPTSHKRIDLAGGVLSVPMTKNGKPHSLSITPLMRKILERRCAGLEPEDELSAEVRAEHIHSMTMRMGTPRFMLHDLRKLVVTAGERLGLLRLCCVES